MIEPGRVEVNVEGGVARVTFSHPKGNSLPGATLAELAAAVRRASDDPAARVVLLQSAGERAFCAGASFDELLAVKDEAAATEFFMGFARLILAMRSCPKFVVARVQGKVVGGGVGVVAASDYALATRAASIRLSELALGIGPFVIGPVVERRIGPGPFAAAAADADWRDADWAERHGLYAQVHDSIEELDAAVSALLERLAGFSPEAMAELKRVFWEDTTGWERLLERRAAISARLVLTDRAQRTIQGMRGR
ncbi:MAG: enoyl-CoA hydratase/isomerase family protein [Acidobacteria bacterium]|nr:MAG: enoyl-CoA hydratase/isomerase family protein [Acidobacteriota bacterium]